MIIPTGEDIRTHHGWIADKSSGASRFLDDYIVMDIEILNEVPPSVERATAVIGGRPADAVETRDHGIAIDFNVTGAIQEDSGAPPETGAGGA